MSKLVIPLEAKTAQIDSRLANIDDQLTKIRKDALDIKFKVFDDKFSKQVAQLGQSVESLNRSSSRIDTSGVNRATSAFNKLGSAVKMLNTLLIGGLVVKSLDDYTTFGNRLRLVGVEAEETERKLKDLFAVSRQTQTSMKSTVLVFSRLAQASNLKTAEETITTINRLVAIAGVSAQSSSNALEQFAQALAAGKLQGQELNSVMLQLPSLAQAIAKGMGITINELRTAASEGSVTTEAIIKALKKVEKETATTFKDVNLTVGKAITSIIDTLSFRMGELNNTIQFRGITRPLAAFNEFVDKTVDNVNKGIIALKARFSELNDYRQGYIGFFDVNEGVFEKLIVRFWDTIKKIRYEGDLVKLMNIEGFSKQLVNGLTLAVTTVGPIIINELILAFTKGIQWLTKALGSENIFKNLLVSSNLNIMLIEIKKNFIALLKEIDILFITILDKFDLTKGYEKFKKGFMSLLSVVGTVLAEIHKRFMQIVAVVDKVMYSLADTFDFTRQYEQVRKVFIEIAGHLNKLRIMITKTWDITAYDTLATVGSFGARVINVFANIYDKVIGHSYWTDLCDDIINKWLKMWTKMGNYLDSFKESVLGMFSSLNMQKNWIDKTKEGFIALWNFIRAKFKDLMDDTERYRETVSKTFISIFDSISNAIVKMFDTFRKNFDKMLNTIDRMMKKVSRTMKNFFSGFTQKFTADNIIKFFETVNNTAAKLVDRTASFFSQMFDPKSTSKAKTEVDKILNYLRNSSSAIITGFVFLMSKKLVQDMGDFGPILGRTLGLSMIIHLTDALLGEQATMALMKSLGVVLKILSQAIIQVIVNVYMTALQTFTKMTLGWVDQFTGISKLIGSKFVANILVFLKIASFMPFFNSFKAYWLVTINGMTGLFATQMKAATKAAGMAQVAAAKQIGGAMGFGMMSGISGKFGSLFRAFITYNLASAFFGVKEGVIVAMPFILEFVLGMERVRNIIRLVRLEILIFSKTMKTAIVGTTTYKTAATLFEQIAAQAKTKLAIAGAAVMAFGSKVLRMFATMLVKIITHSYWTDLMTGIVKSLNTMIMIATLRLGVFQAMVLRTFRVIAAAPLVSTVFGKFTTLLVSAKGLPAVARLGSVFTGLGSSIAKAGGGLVAFMRGLTLVKFAKTALTGLGIGLAYEIITGTYTEYQKLIEDKQQEMFESQQKSRRKMEKEIGKLNMAGATRDFGAAYGLIDFSRMTKNQKKAFDARFVEQAKKIDELNKELEIFGYRDEEAFAEANKSLEKIVDNASKFNAKKLVEGSFDKAFAEWNLLDFLDQMIGQNLVNAMPGVIGESLEAVKSSITILFDYTSAFFEEFYKNFQRMLALPARMSHAVRTWWYGLWGKDYEGPLDSFTGQVAQDIKKIRDWMEEQVMAPRRQGMELGRDLGVPQRYEQLRQGLMEGNIPEEFAKDVRAANNALFDEIKRYNNIVNGSKITVSTQDVQRHAEAINKLRLAYIDWINATETAIKFEETNRGMKELHKNIEATQEKYKDSFGGLSEATVASLDEITAKYLDEQTAQLARSKARLSKNLVTTVEELFNIGRATTGKEFAKEWVDDKAAREAADKLKDVLNKTLSISGVKEAFAGMIPNADELFKGLTPGVAKNLKQLTDEFARQQMEIDKIINGALDSYSDAAWLEKVNEQMVAFFRNIEFSGLSAFDKLNLALKFSGVEPLDESLRTMVTIKDFERMRGPLLEIKALQYQIAVEASKGKDVQDLTAKLIQRQKDLLRDVKDQLNEISRVDAIKQIFNLNDLESVFMALRSPDILPLESKRKEMEEAAVQATRLLEIEKDITRQAELRAEAEGYASEARRLAVQIEQRKGAYARDPNVQRENLPTQWMDRLAAISGKSAQEISKLSSANLRTFEKLAQRQYDIGLQIGVPNLAKGAQVALGKELKELEYQISKLFEETKLSDILSRSGLQVSIGEFYKNLDRYRGVATKMMQVLEAFEHVPNLKNLEQVQIAFTDMVNSVKLTESDFKQALSDVGLEYEKVPEQIKQGLTEYIKRGMMIESGYFSKDAEEIAKRWREEFTKAMQKEYRKGSEYADILSGADLGFTLEPQQFKFTQQQKDLFEKVIEAQKNLRLATVDEYAKYALELKQLQEQLRSSVEATRLQKTEVLASKLGIDVNVVRLADQKLYEGMLEYEKLFDPERLKQFANDPAAIRKFTLEQEQALARLKDQAELYSTQLNYLTKNWGKDLLDSFTDGLKEVLMGKKSLKDFGKDLLDKYVSMMWDQLITGFTTGAGITGRGGNFMFESIFKLGQNAASALFGTADKSIEPTRYPTSSAVDFKNAFLGGEDKYGFDQANLDRLAQSMSFSGTELINSANNLNLAASALTQAANDLRFAGTGGGAGGTQNINISGGGMGGGSGIKFDLGSVATTAAGGIDWSNLFGGTGSTQGIKIDVPDIKLDSTSGVDWSNLFTSGTSGEPGIKFDSTNLSDLWSSSFEDSAKNFDAKALASVGLNALGSSVQESRSLMPEIKPDMGEANKWRDISTGASLLGMVAGMAGSASGSGNTAGGGQQALGNAAETATKTFKEQIDAMLKKLPDLLKIFSMFAQRRAEGGAINGVGTGYSDSVPALLSHGEYVVNAGATRRFRPILEAINSGNARKFADGGGVGTSSNIQSVTPLVDQVDQSNVNINLGITGDISRQTRQEVLRMIPDLAKQIEVYKKEKRIGSR